MCLCVYVFMCLCVYVCMLFYDEKEDEDVIIDTYLENVDTYEHVYVYAYVYVYMSTCPYDYMSICLYVYFANVSEHSDLNALTSLQSAIVQKIGAVFTGVLATTHPARTPPPAALP